MDSILTSIKQLLGVESTDTSFDVDLIIHINSVLMVLSQLGVGPEEGFKITSANETWSQFLTTPKNLEAAKTYVFSKVRLVFDPPSSSFVIDALQRNVDELEYRLLVQAEE